jgi:hypothetical protein
VIVHLPGIAVKIAIFDAQLEALVDSERVSQAGMGQRLLNVIGIRSTPIDSSYIQNKVTEFVSGMHEIISKSTAESREFNVVSLIFHLKIHASVVGLIPMKHMNNELFSRW